MFRAGDIRRNVSLGFTQIYKALYGDAMFVSLLGAQIWWPEANKNCSHLLRAHKHIYEYLFSYKDCSDYKISAGCHFSHLSDSILDRNFNIVSRKSLAIQLEIQPCFITRRKTLSN